MIGVDNDPATYYRPNNSSGAVYLNCLMYKELLAMAYICEKLSDYDKKAYYEKEAKEIAEKTVQLFGKDIENCGKMHEYYNPETGEPVNNIGFQSWNLLVCNMIAYLDGEKRIKEF